MQQSTSLRRVRNGTKRARPDSKLAQKMRAAGYYLCTDVAEKVGVHKATIYRWIKDRRVNAKDFNGAYYVEWASVLKFCEEIADLIGLDN